MKSQILSIITIIIVMACFHNGSAQNSEPHSSLENVWRVKFINPGVEYELPAGITTSFIFNAGIGYGGSYPELGRGSGFQYVIAPFIDVEFRKYYNREKRFSKGRSVRYNSGNFVSVRAIGNGWAIAENVNRKDDLDFAIGPTWGLQRNYDKLHFLMNLGPTYYFNTIGNSGFYPLMLQLNFGLNL